MTSPVLLYLYLKYRLEKSATLLEIIAVLPFHELPNLQESHLPNYLSPPVFNHNAPSLPAVHPIAVVSTRKFQNTVKIRLT